MALTHVEDLIILDFKTQNYDLEVPQIEKYSRGRIFMKEVTTSRRSRSANEDTRTGQIRYRLPSTGITSCGK